MLAERGEPIRRGQVRPSRLLSATRSAEQDVRASLAAPRAYTYLEDSAMNGGATPLPSLDGTGSDDLSFLRGAPRLRSVGRLVELRGSGRLLRRAGCVPPLAPGAPEGGKGSTPMTPADEAKFVRASRSETASLDPQTRTAAATEAWHGGRAELGSIRCKYRKN
jgi:hypothetical protein